MKYAFMVADKRPKKHFYKSTDPVFEEMLKRVLKRYSKELPILEELNYYVPYNLSEYVLVKHSIDMWIGDEVLSHDYPKMDKNEFIMKNGFISGVFTSVSCKLSACSSSCGEIVIEFDRYCFFRSEYEGQLIRKMEYIEDKYDRFLKTIGIRKNSKAFNKIIKTVHEIYKKVNPDTLKRDFEDYSSLSMNEMVKRLRYTYMMIGIKLADRYFERHLIFPGRFMQTPRR